MRGEDEDRSRQPRCIPLAMIFMSFALFTQVSSVAADCSNASALSISGANAVSSPGTSLYTATGGVPPYTWSVMGYQTQPGFSIDGDGSLTLTSQASGSYRITLRDACGAVGTLDGRVSNSGYCNSNSPGAKALSATVDYCPSPWSSASTSCTVGPFSISEACIMWAHAYCFDGPHIDSVCGLSCGDPLSYIWTRWDCEWQSSTYPPDGTKGFGGSCPGDSSSNAVPNTEPVGSTANLGNGNLYHLAASRAAHLFIQQPRSLQRSYGGRLDP